MSFWLITAVESLPELPVLAHLLGSAFHLDRDTAASEARKSWGVLGTGLTEAEADSLAAGCSDFGVRTIKLPAPEPMPRPEHAVKAVIGNGAAEFIFAGGLSIGAAPGEIEVLAAAPIKHEFTRTETAAPPPSAGGKALRLGIMAVTGLPLGFGKPKEVKKEVRGSELTFYLDIVPAAGLRRIRVSSDDFDFSCLKSGKTYSSQVNFRLLCAELAAFAPGASRNAGLRAILEGRPLWQLAYNTLADLEKETLRLVLARGK